MLIKTLFNQEPDKWFLLASVALQAINELGEFQCAENDAPSCPVCGGYDMDGWDYEKGPNRGHTHECFLRQFLDLKEKFNVE